MYRSKQLAAVNLSAVSQMTRVHTRAFIWCINFYGSTPVMWGGQFHFIELSMIQMYTCVQCVYELYYVYCVCMVLWACILVHVFYFWQSSPSPVGGAVSFPLSSFMPIPSTDSSWPPGACLSWHQIDKHTNQVAYLPVNILFSSEVWWNLPYATTKCASQKWLLIRWIFLWAFRTVKSLSGCPQCELLSGVKMCSILPMAKFIV